FPMFVEIIKKSPDLNLPSLGLGLLAFFTIYFIKKFHKTLPAGLIALVLATTVLMFFNLDQHGVVIVGKIPKGLPGFHLPSVSFEMLSRLFGPVVVIALVSFAEAYAVGKSISGQTKQKVDVNQELIGQGMANFIGAFFQSYPVSGSFSRTAINYAAGAKTGIASVVSSLIVIISLLFLTPLFTYIPRAALAALVINAVLLLFHPKEVFILWKMNRHDGIVAITVFILGLVTKPDYALLIGVIISLMFFLWKTMHPRIVRITKDPEKNMFLNGDAYNKPSCPQILHLRSDSEIYFGNAEFLVEHMIELLDEQETPVKFLLLDFQAVGFIDLTGIDELRVLMEETKIRDIQSAFVSIHIPVMNIYKSSEFINEINHEYIFNKRGDAFSSLFTRIDHSYCKKSCPHNIFNECSLVK
ncbi:solute carrier family 23 protein, partial [Desulfobacterales bacterium HSG17]|nr:solute carrier family 23 protein [Desulfobacterales bacterium HSG17]